MKRKSEVSSDDLRPEYTFDYSRAVRGKYHRRLIKENTNVVVLDPDVAKTFRNLTAVNDALRSLLKVARLSTSSRRTARKHTAA